MRVTAAEAQRYFGTTAWQRSAGKKRDNPEDWLSAAVNMWLDLPEVQLRGMAFHVPNETASKAEAGRKKWIGVKAGVADWIFTGPPLVAIELKVGKNRQSVSQKKWGEGLEAGWNEQVWINELNEAFGNFNSGQLEGYFAPRYRVCRSLGDVAVELHEANISICNLDQASNAAEKVRTWFAVQHGREIP